MGLIGGGESEKWCTGLDTLANRCGKYYAQGARFAKWRTALTINVEAGCPTDLAIDVAAQDLARYARICQQNGLVPIVEPEILLDGDHDIATTAVQTLDRCLPPAMPGVTFLSGGISEEDSSIYLNEINKAGKKGAFATTFSFSRALQSSCIKIWGGKEENYKKAQDQLVARAQANAEASVGKSVPGSQPSDEESLFVKDYVY